MEVSLCGQNQSLSLREDGTYQAGEASLGFANDEAGIAAFRASRMYADSPLVISEILLSSSDISYQGKFCDLVEIFNRSAETVNTAGWYLTDGEDPFRYALPARDLAPGEYMVILCDRTTTGFALSEKDVLRLISPAHLGCLPVSCSAGSVSYVAWNGQESYVAMEPTPGYPNTAQGHEQYLRQEFGRGLMISEVMTSNQSYLPGAYATTCDWIELYNASDEYRLRGALCE